MANTLEALEADLDALRGTWAGAFPAFGEGLPAFSEPADLAALGDAGLVRVADALAQLRRRADGVLARVADEISRRSGPEFGPDGLAKQHGFHNAGRLLAAVTGESFAGCGRLLAVGAAVRPRSSFAGDPLPGRHPSVGAAIAAGTISLDAAALIVGMLDRVAPRADPERATAYEAELVRFAGGASLMLLSRAVTLAEGRLDVDGAEPRDEAIRHERSLTIREGADGVVHLTATLDAVTAAPVKAAIEALATESLRRRDDEATVVEDRRPIPQRNADALADLCRHALGCSDAPIGLATTTVVVRIGLEELRSGVGTASIDGIDRPISAATARRLAASADVIPVVLGGDSLPLDLGRTARLFTRAQRLALGERDGGCASCGQNITHVEAHHIAWWERDAGPTDLDNGVLLCSFCHHQVHREGWAVRAVAGRVWFIPPPHVDPDRRPRLGGRARFELLEVAA